MQTQKQEATSRVVDLGKAVLLYAPEALVAITLALLIVFLVISVFSRYVMNLGLAWSDELSRLLFIWITLIGFALAIHRRANVGMDWLVSKRSSKTKRWIYLAQDIIIFGFSIFFTWASYVTVKFAMLQRMPALDISTAWLYGSCLFAGVFMMIYAFFNIIQTSSDKKLSLREVSED